MKQYFSILSVVVLLATYLLPGTSRAVTSYAESDRDSARIYGYCHDVEGIVEARNCALEVCSKFGSGCKVKFTSNDEGYGAFAKSRYGYSIVNGSSTQAIANREAMKDCSRHGPGCKVVKTWYDSHRYIGDWERNYGDDEPAAPVPFNCTDPNGCYTESGQFVPFAGGTN